MGKCALGSKAGDYCAGNRVRSPGAHVSHTTEGSPALGRMSGGHLGLPFLVGIEDLLLLTEENVVRRNPFIHSTFISSFVHSFIHCQSLFMPLVFVLAILP